MTDVSPQADANDAPSPSLEPWIAAVLGVFLILLAAGAFLLIGQRVHASLAVEAFGGLVVLAVSLAGLLIIARALGVATPKAALGLPSGSVRALLAFSLVVVFVVIASWSLDGHGDVPAPARTLAGPLAQADVDKQMAILRADLPASRFILNTVPDGKDTFDIKVVDIGSQQQYFDLQKQVLTIVATLLVSIVSFYFGGKSATDASSAAADSLNKLNQALTGPAPGRASTTSAGPDPAKAVSYDGLTALNTQVKALSDAAGGLQTDLGAAPLDDLGAAAKDAPTAQVQQLAAAAQSALGDLTKAASAAATDAQRAGEALAAVAAGETDAAKLQPVADRLNQLLQDATASKTSADAAHAAFAAARDQVMKLTAKG